MPHQINGIPQQLTLAVTPVSGGRKAPVQKLDGGQQNVLLAFLYWRAMAMWRASSGETR